jgi:hypothetical protein
MKYWSGRECVADLDKTLTFVTKFSGEELNTQGIHPLIDSFSK